VPTLLDSHTLLSSRIVNPTILWCNVCACQLGWLHAGTPCCRTTLTRHAESGALKSAEPGALRQWQAPAHNCARAPTCHCHTHCLRAQQCRQLGVLRSGVAHAHCGALCLDKHCRWRPAVLEMRRVHTCMGQRCVSSTSGAARAAWCLDWPHACGACWSRCAP
jgi:hypothetical protein